MLWLKGMMRDYVKESEYQDMEELRELLSKVTDEQKLNILQQTLHKAVHRDDVEMVTTILSSLQSSNRLKFLLMGDDYKCTPLHRAAEGSHTESVKAILNSLTEDQQLRLLTEERYGKTAVEMASGETADVLSEYKNRAADSGEFLHRNSHFI